MRWTARIVTLIAMLPAGLTASWPADSSVFRPLDLDFPGVIDTADALALAEIYLALDLPAQALMLGEQLASLVPDQAEPRLVISRALLALRRPAAAEAALREVLRAWPGHADARLLLAALLRADGRRAEADLLDGGEPDAVSFVPPPGDTEPPPAPATSDLRDPRALRQLALLELGSGRAAQAVWHLLAAARLQPDAETWGLLAHAEACAGRWDDTLRHAESALRLAPDDWRAGVLRAVALRMLDRFDEAEREASAWQERNPLCYAAHYERGAVLGDQDRDREALPHLARAVELAPECAGCWAALGHARLRTGQFDAAGAALARASELGQEDAALLDQHALLAMYQHRAGDAEQLLRRALELEPDAARCWENLGWLLFDQGRLAEAETCLRELSRLKADGWAGYDTLPLAAFHALTGHRQRARDTVLEAVRRSQDPDFLAWAAYHLLAADYAREAEAILDIARSRDPDAAWPVLVLARVYRRQGRAERLPALLEPLLRVAAGGREGTEVLLRSAEAEALLGHPARAAQQLALATERGYGADAEEMATIAAVLALAGDRDGALAALREALDAGYADLRWLRLDPDLDDLRTDPRFEEMLAGRVTVWPVRSRR